MRKWICLSWVIILVSVSVCFAIEAPKNLRIVNDPYFLQDFQVDRGVSRTSGVAPLSVHFNAGFNASTATDRGFHNYDYTWDFGDPASGNWGTTGKPKNRAKGPVAAHIYETPGTYSATLTIRSANGVADTGIFIITVTDPDVVFSGPHTTCISDRANNSFNGCPEGATQVATDDIGQITQYLGTGRRVLLQRGSSWTSNGITMEGTPGPVSIGAYGAGTSSGTTGIYSNAPHITLTAGSFCDLTNKQDWRIADISFSGARTVAAAINGTWSMRQILLHRLKTDGFETPIGWTHYNQYANQHIDQMAVVECNISNADRIGMYVGAERFMLLGNVAKNARESHTVRVWQAYLGVLSNNDISGSSITTDAGRHALKFHGPGYSSFNGVNSLCEPERGTTCLRNRTAFTVISDNYFGASGPWPVSIGPQDSFTDSYLSDLIFERNRYHADYGTQSSRDVMIAIGLEAGYCTLRNNIIDGTGANNSFTGISIWQRGAEPAPVGNEVYHNTIYRSDNASGGQVGINVVANAARTVVRNNAVSFPNAAGNAVIIRNESKDLVQDHNMIAADMEFVAPVNNNPLIRDFTPQPDAIIDESGSQEVPLLDDLVGNTRRRDGYYDIGAVEN